MKRPGRIPARGGDLLILSTPAQVTAAGRMHDWPSSDPGFTPPFYEPPAYQPGSQAQVDAIVNGVVEQLKPFIADAFDAAIARAFADKNEDAP